ncbi:MAG: MEDS domain-containing protein [Propionibacteriaceae bacterium]
MNSQALELAPGTHLCCMYRGLAQRDELLGPYVSAGLQAGHTCFVAVSDGAPDRIQAFGSVNEPGELIVRTAADQIFSQDDFDIDKILAFWETTVSTALNDDGAPFVRLSAEATWWLTQLPSVAVLMDYEARLNDFAAQHPQSILCRYDIDELGASVVFDAMKVHPRIWLSGLVLENPFYGPAG